MTETVVKAKCVFCKRKQTVREGDVAPGDHPRCSACGAAALVAVSVTVQKRREET